MKIGYMRISKADGSQVFDLQVDALLKEGVEAFNIYQDKASGAKDDRPGLQACLKACRKGDILYIWKLDRLGRSLRHLIRTVEDLTNRGIMLKVLSGQGASIDTTTSSGKLMFSIFGAFAEFEREIIRERVIAGAAAARARGKMGGRKLKLSRNQVLLAQSAMRDRNTNVSRLARELNVTTATLYKYVDAFGNLREYGEKVLGEQSTNKVNQRHQKVKEIPNSHL